MYRFMQDRGFDNFADLHRWSIDNVADFWQAVADFGEVEFTRPASEVLVQPGDLTTARFFDDAELSFPAHVLRHRGDRAALKQVVACWMPQIRRWALLATAAIYESPAASARLRRSLTTPAYTEPAAPTPFCDHFRRPVAASKVYIVPSRDSNRMRSTWAPVRTVRFARCCAGRRNALLALHRTPLR